MEIKSSALWLKKTKSGDTYFSVKVELESGEKLNVNLFKNKFKKDNEKAPDYKSIDKKQEEQKPKPPIVPARPTDEGIDLPF